MKNSNLSFPLTPSQSLLWIGQEMNPESPMYNMIMTYEIKGAISVAHFKTAFRNLVAKSDALRSVFTIVDNVPVQQFLLEIDFEVMFVDFSKEEHPEEVYCIWRKKRAQHLFNVQQCLFDCVLIKLAENKFVWYINQHHLITDGWSTTIIFSLMSKLYANALRDNVAYIEEVPQYKSYVQYFQEIATSKKTKEATEYWQQKTLNLETPAPLYFKKKQLLQTNSERALVKLGSNRSIKIKELANEKGIRGWTLDTTLYNLFLTVLFSFLHRITGQEHLVVGAPSHNRATKKFKNTIGLFIETFPMEVAIEEGETFLSLFKKIQIESNYFLKNAQVGSTTPDVSRSFSTFFNYINAANTKFDGFDVATEWVHPEHTDPRHHVRLHVHDFDNTGEINLYFDLNSSVFNKEERAVLPQHFLKILDACLLNHHQEINHVSLVTDTELDKIKDWNATDKPYSAKENLLSKFCVQAKKTPNKVALLFGEKRLSYRQLDEQSNQVANFLIEKGIQKSDIVILSMDRSLEMMIYMYGVVKAGGVYLPVAVNTPTERLSFIIEDSNSFALFYNHTINEVLQTKANCYNTAVLKEEVCLLATTQPKINIQPEDLAYVIYTSGSTGKPKGVKCHHKGICNRLNWMVEEHPLTDLDVLLQKTPVTFDVSLWELFWPLQVGASLVIEKPEGHKNPEGLIATIKKYNITIIHFVPSMLSVFMKTAMVESCNSLKKIFCSGEELPAKLVADTYDKLDVDVYNLYGPTEASIEVSSWLCKKSTKADYIPIGYPVANTKLYIVDAFMNLAPIGIPGELYIAGDQVAKGYLNREELTKEKFITTTFSDAAETKMYKTGDLVKYDADGAIIYLGRIDHQIKLRGQRVELGEIETNIEKHPAIVKAVVNVDEKENLVAYYTGSLAATSEIIANVKGHLPEYMIPSVFVYVEKFELLSSGKIDRKKLKVITPLENNVVKKIRVAPQNEIEEMIHDTWLRVIELEEIGINEDFISIGGNSLLAISITSRLKEILELELSINDVFNYPTIKQYALYVEEMITELLNE